MAKTLDEAVVALMAAKQTEDEAKQARIEAEKEVLKFNPAKLEGSETISVGPFKVTIKGSLNYKCSNLPELLEFLMMQGITTEECPVVQKQVLDETRCKHIRANNPDLWRQMAKWVTTEAAKPNLSIKV